MTEGFLTRNVCFPAYRLSPEVPEHTTNNNNNDCRPPELSLVAPFLDFFFFLSFFKVSRTCLSPWSGLCLLSVFRLTRVPFAVSCVDEKALCKVWGDLRDCRGGGASCVCLWNIVCVKYIVSKDEAAWKKPPEVGFNYFILFSFALDALEGKASAREHGECWRFPMVATVVLMQVSTERRRRMCLVGRVSAWEKVGFILCMWFKKKKSNTTGKMSAFGRASACFYIPDTPGEENSDNLGRFKISFYDFMKHSRGILTWTLTYRDVSKIFF